MIGMRIIPHGILRIFFFSLSQWYNLVRPWDSDLRILKIMVYPHSMKRWGPTGKSYSFCTFVYIIMLYNGTANMWFFVCLFNYFSLPSLFKIYLVKFYRVGILNPASDCGYLFSIFWEGGVFFPFAFITFWCLNLKWSFWGMFSTSSICFAFLPLLEKSCFYCSIFLPCWLYILFFPIFVSGFFQYFSMPA